MYKMLIADDERAARDGLRSLVDWQLHGVEIVAECENGADAVDATRTHKPDIAIVDIRMPFVDGIEYCRRTHSMSPRPRIIIASAYDRFEYAQEAIRYGVSGYLLKPYDDTELREAVLRALHDPVGSDGRDALAISYPESGARTGPQAIDRSFRRVVDAYIRDSYRTNPSLEGLADQLQLTPAYLSRRIHSEYRMTFTDLVADYRCRAARALLRDPSARVYEVAESVGYSDVRSFSERFKRVVGCTPSEFRRGH